MFCLPKQICTNRQISHSDWNLFTPHLLDSGRRDCETLIAIFKFTYFRVVFITKKSSIFKVSVHIEMRLVSGPAGLYSKRVCLKVWSLNQSAIHGSRQSVVLKLIGWIKSHSKKHCSTFLHFANLLFRENRKLIHFCMHCSRVFTNFSSRSDHVVDHSREQTGNDSTTRSNL